MKWSEVWDRIKFWKIADRLGPDIPYTHWRLHFKSTMRALCERKFKYFGNGAEFRPGAYAICCSKINLGNRVVIRPGSMLFADPRGDGAGITIEDNVMLGSGVHIYVHNHRFDDPNIPIIDQGHYPSAPVVLKQGCWIGANAIILPGVTVGENSVVGAGSVVTKNIPSRVLAMGNPATIKRTIRGGHQYADDA
ncbi:MAG: acyltransferase [Sulfuricella sp.]|nr:acyltransferase [Sulfuricella sp.]